MIGRLIIYVLIVVVPATMALAHPHSFVECSLSYVMDEKGLVGFRQRWVLDEMTTVSVLDVVDSDRDGILSDKEKMAIRDLSVNSLGAYHYFTVAHINGNEFPIRKIINFSAQLKEGKLIYDFLVPCRVAATRGKPQEVKVAVFDDSFYTFIVYTKQGSPPIDPTKDPLFANRQAPAKPEDFRRFSDAIGLGKFEGSAKIQGDVSPYKLSSTVKDEPEMAYFYKQITPQAFVLSFELK